jgi:DNA invertase Pin-like site-specific DNA recombinase
MQAEMQKVRPEHLKRDAFLYVRQSTPRQVLENQESIKRPYALLQRAIALGWHSDHIVVIDNAGPSFTRNPLTSRAGRLPMCR